MILPSAGTLGEAAYLDWAKEMKGNFENKVQVVWDNEVTAWPKNSSIFILGTKNKFVNQINEAGKTLNFVVTGDVASVNGTDHDLKQQTVFAVLPHPANSNSSLAWLSAPNSTSLARSAAKIPHYGKYSVLVFLGEQNQHKSQWPIRRSPLIHEL